MGLLLLDTSGVTKDTVSRAGLNRRMYENGALSLVKGFSCRGIHNSITSSSYEIAPPVFFSKSQGKNAATSYFYSYFKERSG
jgi:hypothetical protein